jgi:YHS domain-containing protein
MGKTTANNINIDPVCGMKVKPSSTEQTASYQEQSFYFCAEACRKAFELDPRRYLKSMPAQRKGWWGRYLDRLAKANEKTFGKKRPKCC